MSKHTPGPWLVHTNNVAEGSCGNIKTLTGADHYANHNEPYVAVVGADGEVVCDNAHYYSQRLHAKNARLIAAAPDLLEALEAFTAHFDQHQKPMTEDEKVQNDLDWFDAVDAARKAIARAKGESS